MYDNNSYVAGKKETKVTSPFGLYLSHSWNDIVCLLHCV